MSIIKKLKVEIDGKPAEIKLDIEPIIMPLIKRLADPQHAEQLRDDLYPVDMDEEPWEPRRYCGWPKEHCPDEIETIATNREGKPIGFLCKKHGAIYRKAHKLPEPTNGPLSQARPHSHDHGHDHPHRHLPQLPPRVPGP